MTNVLKLEFNTFGEYRDPIDPNKKMDLSEFLN